MQEQIYNDIITGHRERMLNLRKYYPFFRLCENSFLQFKEGKYEMLDMGYIVMAVLRFFIEENNFKEKDVTYPEYLDFMKKLLYRDFGLKLSDEETKEVSDYIFDKIKNDGKPFSFEYYDPQDRKKKLLRTKLIESRIKESMVWYSISPDGVEFYLDTKEIKDESRISVQQLLLEKLIKSSNFKGGTEVVEKINNEVSMLMSRKNEVLGILSTDVFAGVEAYQRFVETGMRWFDDEERLFAKNKELIESVYAKAEKENDNSEKYYENLREIYKLDTQLKITMNRHGELLRACTELKVTADDIIRRAKLRRLRSGMDFGRMLDSMIKSDNINVLEAMVVPLFKPNIKKKFNLVSVDEMLTYKAADTEAAEKVISAEPEKIIFEDELEDERIRFNLQFFMKNLMECLNAENKFDLRKYIKYLTEKYGESILFNGDFYTFLIHLCQKKEYFSGDSTGKETFLDDMIKNMDCERICPFRIIMGGDGENEDTLVIGDSEITNIGFERIVNND